MKKAHPFVAAEQADVETQADVRKWTDAHEEDDQAVHGYSNERKHDAQVEIFLCKPSYGSSPATFSVGEKPKSKCAKKHQGRGDFPHPTDERAELREKIIRCCPRHIEVVPAGLLQNIVERAVSAGGRPIDGYFLDAGGAVH